MKNVISQKIKWSPLGPSINQVKQYGSRNNIIISGIPDDKSDNDLESTVIDIMTYYKQEILQKSITY